MKKIIALSIALFFIWRFEAYSQTTVNSPTILKKSGGRWCDCYKGKGSALSMERFDLYWDDYDRPDPNNSDFRSYKWNTLIKEYYCGCNIGNGAESVLISESYWRNGREHGTWKEYYRNNKIKTIKIYQNGILINKTNYTENGDEIK